ncbi:MAG: hypothetical protein ACTS7E_00260 [Arsenophonus sp. NC-CH8-MAG3]
MAKKNYSSRYITGQPAKRILPVSEYMLDNDLPIGIPSFSESDELGILS